MEESSQSLLTSRFYEDYKNKCMQWRSEPVMERKCNNVGCFVVFILLLGGFLAAIIYYIREQGEQNFDSMLVIVYAEQIMAFICFSVVLSYCFTFAIKLVPKIMVYVLAVLSPAVFLGPAIFAFIKNQIAIAVPLLLLFILYTILLVCVRKQIQLGVTVIRVAAEFLSDKWGIFLVPVIQIAFNLIFSLFWIYSLNCIWLIAEDKRSRGQSDAVQVAIGILSFVVWLFLSLVFYYIMSFTVAVACSFWYYRVQNKHYLTSGYKWFFTSAFGPIVWGSLIFLLVNLARLIVKTTQPFEKKKGDSFCQCLVTCGIKNVQLLLRILNNNSIIVMAVTGESYVKSVKTTIGILSRFLPLMSVTQTISNLVTFWGVAIIAGTSGFISYMWLDEKGVDGGDLVIIMVISILGSIFISSYIYSVLIEAISAVFIFYCFDVRFKELGFRNHNMPSQIKEAMGSTNSQSKPQ